MASLSSLNENASSGHNKVSSDNFFISVENFNDNIVINLIAIIISESLNSLQ